MDMSAMRIHLFKSVSWTSPADPKSGWVCSFCPMPFLFRPILCLRLFSGVSANHTLSAPPGKREMTARTVRHRRILIQPPLARFLGAHVPIRNRDVGSDALVAEFDGRVQRGR